MKDSTLVFCYGLELNLTLLHCVVGGPKPVAAGCARLRGFSRAWNVAGHLPNLAVHADGLVEGALVRLTAIQFQRLSGARLVPALYLWRRVTVMGPLLRRRQALTLWSPQGHTSGAPGLSVWSEVVLGALQQGLSDAAILDLLRLRPNDRLEIERRWARPFPTPSLLSAA